MRTPHPTHLVRRLVAAVMLVLSPALAEQPGDDDVLAKRLPEVRLENSALADVVDFLRDVAQVNIYVNWRALEGVGIDRNAPVSVRVRDVPLAKVLRLVLDEVGGGTVELDFVMEDGVISISTAEDLGRARPAAGGSGDQAELPGEYFVTGVERAGTYALSENQITLRQALIAAGGNTIKGKHLVVVSRDPTTGADRGTSVAIDDLLAGIAKDQPVRPGDVLMVVDEAPKSRKPGDPAPDAGYRVEGTVPRPGAYPLERRRTSLLQALVIAGVDPFRVRDKQVTLYRHTGDGEDVVYRGKIQRLIDDRDGGPQLNRRDRIVVGDADGR